MDRWNLLWELISPLFPPFWKWPLGHLQSRGQLALYFYRCCWSGWILITSCLDLGRGSLLVLSAFLMCNPFSTLLDSWILSEHGRHQTRMPDPNHSCPKSSVPSLLLSPAFLGLLHFICFSLQLYPKLFSLALNSAPSSDFYKRNPNSYLIFSTFKMLTETAYPMSISLFFTTEPWLLTWAARSPDIKECIFQVIAVSGAGWLIMWETAEWGGARVTPFPCHPHPSQPPLPNLSTTPWTLTLPLASPVALHSY